MQTAIVQGEPPIEVMLRRSDRARRMTLRVSRLDGRVTLTLPRGVAEAEAQAFAQDRADWIRKHIADCTPTVPVGFGTKLPVLGQNMLVVAGTGKRVQLDDQHILVPGPSNRVGPKLKSWLQQTARSELAYASDRYAAALGQSYSKLTIRDTRSRWGSCSSAKGLMYSWRLIMAPAEVMTYVAAHEVAHLAQMNHSPAFWDLVEQLYGPYKAPRTWLRTNGHALHAYRFN